MALCSAPRRALCGAQPTPSLRAGAPRRVVLVRAEAEVKMPHWEAVHATLTQNKLESVSAAEAQVTPGQHTHHTSRPRKKNLTCLISLPPSCIGRPPSLLIYPHRHAHTINAHHLHAHLGHTPSKLPPSRPLPGPLHVYLRCLPTCVPDSHPTG